MGTKGSPQWFYRSIGMATGLLNNPRVAGGVASMTRALLAKHNSASERIVLGVRRQKVTNRNKLTADRNKMFLGGKCFLGTGSRGLNLGEWGSYRQLILTPSYPRASSI